VLEAELARVRIDHNSVRLHEAIGYVLTQGRRFSVSRNSCDTGSASSGIGGHSTVRQPPE
jgi:hypothetical protein